jgi:hypothetical protein
MVAKSITIEAESITIEAESITIEAESITIDTNIETPAPAGRRVRRQVGVAEQLRRAAGGVCPP